MDSLEFCLGMWMWLCRIFWICILVSTIVLSVRKARKDKLKMGKLFISRLCGVNELILLCILTVLIGLGYGTANVFMGGEMLITVVMTICSTLVVVALGKLLAIGVIRSFYKS